MVRKIYVGLCVGLGMISMTARATTLDGFPPAYDAPAEEGVEEKITFDKEGKATVVVQRNPQGKFGFSLLPGAAPLTVFSVSKGQIRIQPGDQILLVNGFSAAKWSSAKFEKTLHSIPGSLRLHIHRTGTTHMALPSGIKKKQLELHQQEHTAVLTRDSADGLFGITLQGSSITRIEKSSIYSLKAKDRIIAINGVRIQAGITHEDILELIHAIPQELPIELKVKRDVYLPKML